MDSRLLQGLTVLDLAGEPLAMTGRILADMGAEVVKLEPSGGDPLRQAVPLDERSGASLRFLAWNAGKTSIEYDPSDTRVDALLRGADVIIETPGCPGSLEFPLSRASTGGLAKSDTLRSGWTTGQLAGQRSRHHGRQWQSVRHGLP